MEFDNMMCTYRYVVHNVSILKYGLVNQLPNGFEELKKSMGKILFLSNHYDKINFLISFIDKTYYFLVFFKKKIYN